MLNGWLFGCALVLFLCSFLPSPAMAVQVEGLYESERFVSDQSLEQRSAAVKAGLADVLVKVSGHAETIEGEATQQLLEQAEQYLAQFAYQVNQGAAGNSDAAYRLLMHFDAPSVIKFLNEQKLPVWGGNRPGVLVWLAIQGPNGRFVVNSEDNPLLAEILSAEAKRRGVSVMLPLMDLEDSRRVSVGDIWGQFSDRISGASVRYSPDAIYAGRFYRSGAAWKAYWQVQIGSSRQSIELKSDDVRTLFALSVDALAEFLADKYAVVASGAGSGDYVFNVVGLKSVEDYAKLNRYLSSLQVVGRVEVARLDDKGVAYRVALKGTVQQFLSVLALNSYLEPDGSGVASGEQSFFWRP